MTEEGAAMLIAACPNLERLTLLGKSEESKINLKCIEIFSQLQKLKYIKLSHCPDEEGYIAYLRHNNPTLKVKLS